jgi:glycosyltransferase involved in cell wall biosynthesis
MKVGMVTTQFAEVGGVENVVRNLSQQMREKGHEVHLITRERPQNTDQFREFHETHIIEGTESYIDYLKKGRQWFEENAEDFDVLHFHNWSPIIPARKIETPTILTYHGTTLDVTLGNKQYHKAPFYWLIEQYALTTPDKVTSITEAHLKPFHTTDYEIIRNGVNTEKYRPADKDKKQKLRKKHQVKGKGILIVAQHHPNKGHKNLIKACTQLNQEHTLMIPSTGSLTNELKQLADEENINTEFYGKVPEKELIELYQAADIFCLPSWNEGLPLSMLEALSTGLPILVSDVADNRKIVEDSRAGKTVKPKNTEELQEKLQQLLEQRLEEKAANARKYTENNIDWNKVAEKYSEIYREVS